MTYNIFGVQKIMNWPGNSPDLNAIEAAWPWLKRRTTSQRLVRHIQEVIKHEGGNEYKEGTTGHDNRVWKGKMRKGELSRRQDLGDGPLF
ncbi:uncharacterized protein ASPGLDRAFT_53541 [Aspergillus glaucus CBS 516.65]|uniref:Tc1-like transposase DDE domain-containing protein n=1 Tax=Aspergillus glaucus CBS 516.65 TaxID=1160497 RepID=A0A1L9V3N1_ASPGL|nr:hypothetical protein ASPGLDRAFT_53541 [Aspergillus glaucus CBS 516.65]OJJ78544.1 hypothetical protein ASPGLDRAFT_53541 [Aspergillus glaucus CBS 516.65]